MSFDAAAVRRDFPILDRMVHGRPLVYLDNAATTQMPEPVLDAICEQHRLYEANVHRGIHALSEASTARMEDARRIVQRFLNAAAPEEIIFTSGTTASVNLAARCFGEAFLKPGDEVLVTAMEHHSNYVPWQQACRRHGAAFRVLPFDQNGDLCMDRLPEYLTERTKLAAVCAVSNVLGTVNPLREITGMAHAAGAVVFVDGAQYVRHGPIDVQAIGCDFFAFSAHKIMGPAGVGVLYGKRELLERLPPEAFGGGMVDRVTAVESTFAKLPQRLEAGTPNIAGNIALGCALDYFSAIGPEAAAYEKELLSYTEERLRALDGAAVLGAPKKRAGVVSFTLEGVHPFDAASMLDALGIAVRSGRHCAQPLLDACGLTSVLRVSPAFYNTREEIDELMRGLERILPLLR